MARTQYAAYCYLCGKHALCQEQFQKLGNRIVPDENFPEDWLKQIRASAAQLAKPTPKPSR